MLSNIEYIEQKQLLACQRAKQVKQQEDCVPELEIKIEFGITLYFQLQYYMKVHGKIIVLTAATKSHKSHIMTTLARPKVGDRVYLRMDKLWADAGTELIICRDDGSTIP